MDRENCLNIFELYISGRASVGEIARLKSFLNDDESLQKWLETQIVSSPDIIDSNIKMRMLNNIRYSTDYSSTVQNIPVKKEGGRLKLYLKRISNIAAILLPFVIIIGGYMYLKPQEVQLFEVIAKKGEKASLTLSEGTAITMNSDSKITYSSDYNRKDRQLNLNGEAFFDVKHNPQKPFIVKFRDLEIKVLGTSFGVKAYADDDDVLVVLNSGHIQLTTPKELIEMTPNDRIIYNTKTQNTSLEKVNAEDYTDWRHNRLRFENETLDVIMKTISRMHNIDIIFENSQMKSQEFTGTLDNTSIESVLDAIKLTSPVNYRLSNGIVYLYKK